MTSVAAIEPQTRAEIGTSRADIRDAVAMVLARPLLAFGPAVVAGLLALGYLAAATPQYTASTSLLIDARVRPALGSDTISAFADATLVESQVKLITSETVLARVVDTLHLADDPDFGGGKPGAFASLFSRSASPASDANQRATAATRTLAGKVIVKRSDRTYVADIEATSVDPLKAARIADAVAGAFIADQLAARADVARREGDFVEARIAALKGRLEAAETRSETFKRDHGIVDANGKNVGQQELTDATTALAAARTRTTEARAKLDQVNKVVASGRLPDSVGDALKSPTIDKYRSQYAEMARQDANYRETLGERHPAYIETEAQLRNMRRLITEELHRIAEGAANDWQTARDAETLASRQVDAMKKASTSVGGSLVQLHELDREVEANRTSYDKAVHAAEAVQDQAADVPGARVIARAAVPTSASSPKKLAILSLALATGLGLGLGSAFLAGAIGPTRTLPRAMPNLRGVASRAAAPARDRPLGDDRSAVPLVVLPIIDPPVTSARTWVDSLRRPAEVARPIAFAASLASPDGAFRGAVASLAAPLLAARPTGAPLTVLLVGASRGAGTSTLAVNLATVLAEAGRSTFLIDANRAAPSLVDLVGPHTEPALIDMANTTRVIHRLLPYPDTLFVAPVRDGEEALARRLATSGDPEWFEGIGGNFDVVVVDGPCADATSECRLLAATADAIVVVSGPEAVPAARLVQIVADLGCDPGALVGLVRDEGAPGHAPRQPRARSRAA